VLSNGKDRQGYLQKSTGTKDKTEAKRGRSANSGSASKSVFRKPANTSTAIRWLGGVACENGTLPPCLEHADVFRDARGGHFITDDLNGSSSSVTTHQR
jgi:hypothetical protein